jgi:hypothetical protein
VRVSLGRDDHEWGIVVVGKDVGHCRTKSFWNGKERGILIGLGKHLAEGTTTIKLRFVSGVRTGPGLLDIGGCEGKMGRAG